MNQITRYVLAIAVLVFPASFLHAKTLHGFDLSNAAIPVKKILSGGPPRDGIPSIDRPHFIQAGQAIYLKPDDRLLGLSINGVTRAYPINIMNWHEIVNDRLNDTTIVITYCPLCGTGIAFKADSVGTFGVSGLLYNSDVLLYDHQSESLWSQLRMEAVSGPKKGKKLTPIALEHTTWADWKTRHPHTQVLSRRTGFLRDYDRDPYLGYSSTRRLYFPVDNTDNRYHTKEWVVGIEVNGHFKAYPFSELAHAGTNPVKDRFHQQSLHIYYNKQQRTVTVTDRNKQLIPSVQAFWFAWIAFHPDTDVYTATK